MKKEKNMLSFFLTNIKVQINLLVMQVEKVLENKFTYKVTNY